MHYNYPTTYLFTWNPDPKHGRWGDDLNRYIEQLSKTGKFTDSWRCSNKNPTVGDRAFLIKLGGGKKGIFGSGYISSPKPFKEKHWTGGNKDDVDYVEIDFDVLINPLKDEFLSIDYLKNPQSILAKQHWSSQSSGIAIRKEVVPTLEEAWFTFLNDSHVDRHLVDSPENKFTEGRRSEFFSSRVERNPHARNACLEYYGYRCTVCNFDFQEFYGDIGQNFIHVHHLTPVGSIGKEYQINPIEDLRPVCPNCHAMLHKKPEPFSINELKELIRGHNPMHILSLSEHINCKHPK